ncbi:MAG TPA: hypothetical protein PKW80_05505 [Bacteroidales bacterium]|nr:hypothetical protein [Bacteroidales bacterium]
MNIKIFSLPGIVTLIMLCSCNNAVREKQLAKIDSLMAVIDSAGKNLNKINKDTISKRFDTFRNTNKSVAEHYQEYRNEENWNYLCEYQNVRKPFKTMVKRYNSYINDLKTSKEQLENLRHDVEKKLISEEEFNNYFIIEKNSAHEITFKINKQINEVLSQMKNFDTIQPYLLKLIDSYPENKNKK